MIIELIDSEKARELVDDLSALLIDAVEGGASVSFLPPFSIIDARAFWLRVIESGTRLILVAREEERVLGTVSLELGTPPNQPHRAEVTKLLVHRQARRRGLARQLMIALEKEALARGRTLLTLDTNRGGAAEQLYRSLGYVSVGVIPNYSIQADGSLEGTTIFYKELQKKNL